MFHTQIPGAETSVLDPTVGGRKGWIKVSLDAPIVLGEDRVIWTTDSRLLKKWK